jgi:hypothetical protein
VDLRRWILDDHAGIATRFDSSITAHVPRERWRERPGGASSIAHLVLHGTWHADLAVHVVVQGGHPVREAWDARLGVADAERHRGLSEAEDTELVDAVDLEALVGYADAVQTCVQDWLAAVDLAVLDDVPAASARLAGAGVAEERVPWLHGMWRGKPASWFVQWEAIGHRHGHLGEAIALRNRLGLSPI